MLLLQLSEVTYRLDSLSDGVHLLTGPNNHGHLGSRGRSHAGDGPSIDIGYESFHIRCCSERSYKKDLLRRGP